MEMESLSLFERKYGTFASSSVFYLSLKIVIHVSFVQRQLLGDSTCRWICVNRPGEVMKREASPAIREDCRTTWRIYIHQPITGNIAPQL